MEKRAKLIFIASIIGIIILFLLTGFVFAQNNEKEDISETEEIEEEIVSPEKAFIQYLEEKINELPDEEKAEFEKLRKMDPTEVFLKAIEKLN
ncbi:MAG: hypothetical protein AABY16_00700 [Nanoarchaeota archaeon]